MWVCLRFWTQNTEQQRRLANCILFFDCPLNDSLSVAVMTVCSDPYWMEASGAGPEVKANKMVKESEK